MAQLIVRNLEEHLVVTLKRRAAESGHSAEEEHRRILREALSKGRQSMDFKDYLLLGADDLPELDLPPRNHSDEREVAL